MLHHIRISILFSLLLQLITPLAIALEPDQLPSVVISELQTGTSFSAAEEFIELYNAKDEVVNVAGWKLEYRSAGGTTWSKKAELTGQIQPRGFYLVATDHLADKRLDALTSGLSSTGGHIKLVKVIQNLESQNQVIETELDLLGWGTAQYAEGNEPASIPSNTESLKRLFNEDGKVIDTNHNGTDFMISYEPSPESTLPSSVVTDPEPENDPPTPNDEPLPTESPQSYYSLEISELMIDPVPPQTDANDEYVELFNPHPLSINFSGYIVKTGSNLQYSYTLPSMVLGSGEYRVIYVKDSKLILANSEGRAQVLAPNNTAVSELVSYQDAIPGQSWSKVNSIWQWTNQLTPNGPNLTSVISNDQAGSIPNGQVQGINKYSSINIMITELLPDPKKPQTDEDDEYVELYNPNPYDVNLDGYVLKTGSTLKTRHKISDITIKAGQYIVLFSSNVNISLSNSGGAVRLEDDGGNLVSETAKYSKAKEGEAWALINGNWQWTGMPTPAAANVQTAATNTSSKSKRSASTKKSTADKAAETIAKPATITNTRLSVGIIAGIAGLALVYGLYEYRYDIRNKFELVRRHFKDSR